MKTFDLRKSSRKYETLISIAIIAGECAVISGVFFTVLVMMVALQK